jgi:hypothetical protein
MIAAVIISILLLLMFVLMWSLIRSGRAQRHSLSSPNAQDREVDLSALALLLSAQEEGYLRESLPMSEFCVVKRQRIVLAWRYLRVMAKSTNGLIRAAEGSKSGHDREAIQAANEILILAFRIKVNLPLVHLFLLIGWLFPRLSVPNKVSIKPYGQMLERLLFIQKRDRRRLRSAG